MQSMDVDMTKATSLPVNDWAYGLCGCWCADSAICLRSAFCPCVQYGINADRLSPGSYSSSCAKYCCCLVCFLALIPVGLQCFCCDIVHGRSRQEVKRRYGIARREHCECCANCFTVSCCPCCAIAQEALQLKYVALPSAPPQMQMK